MSDDPRISRRTLLAGLTAMGTVGAIAGVGTASYLLDTERVPATVQAGIVVLDARGETNGLSGTSLDFADLDLGGSEIGRVCVTLDEESNPAWTWIRLCPDTEDPSVLCALNAEATLTGATNYASTSVVGSLRDVLTGAVFDGQSLSEGILVTGLDRPHLPGVENEVCLVLSISLPEDLDQSVIDAIRGENLRLEFDAVAEQTRHTTAANPFTTPCEIPECPLPEPAISYLAFCASGGVTESDLTLTVTQWKDGDPYTVDWGSAVPIDTIVVKAGQNTLSYGVGGATSGTVSSEGGTASTVPANDPCPDGTSGVKYEWEVDGWVVDSTGGSPGGQGGPKK